MSGCQAMASIARRSCLIRVGAGRLVAACADCSAGVLVNMPAACRCRRRVDQPVSHVGGRDLSMEITARCDGLFSDLCGRRGEWSRAGTAALSGSVRTELRLESPAREQHGYPPQRHRHRRGRPRPARQKVPERKTAKNPAHLDLVADDFALASARAADAPRPRSSAATARSSTPCWTPDSPWW